MAITSQVRSPATFGEVIVQHWQAAKLLKLSAIKPVFTTIDKRLVRKSLGRLHEADRASLQAAVQVILG
jgi:mRNA interferase MazF